MNKNNYKWTFEGVTVYGIQFIFYITAPDKGQAIAKGIEKVKNKYNSDTNNFNISLKPNF